MEISKVAVIGSGVMGGGIAAHVTNAGIPVTLLDIVPKGAPEGDSVARNAIAAAALAKLVKANPAAFMHARNARLVTIGNLEDNLDMLADADLIIEVVIERLDIKQALYRRIDAVRKAGSVVTSNTSTIPLADLVDGMPDSFKRDFMITHFFNPPRYMRLLELVTGPQTRPEAAAAVARFCDVQLGKGVVVTNDTPGFIGNRIGIYWLQVAVKAAFDMGISIEEADAVMGTPVGVPRTGVFGLIDLIGLDLMPHVLASMQSTLAKDDPFHAEADVPELITKMIADGYTGRKGKGGFYRMDKSRGERVKQSISLASGEYADSRKPRVAAADASKAAAKSGPGDALRALVGHDSDPGRYAWRVLARSLGYTASLVPEIADDIVAVDAGMRLGYNWKYGPFELIDRMGAKWFADKLVEDGMPVPPMLASAVEAGSFYRVHDGALQYLTTAGEYADVERPEGVQLLSDVKLAAANKPVAKNGSASLWDIGDDVLCLEFHSKMNSIDVGTMQMVGTAIETVTKRGAKGLVIHNEAENFSIGANIGLALFAANMAAYSEVEDMVKGGQDAYMALKYAPFPVVAAPAGMALGGGCEIVLHADAVVAHAETYIGLVEVGVGLVPGWGGCKELLTRWYSNKKRPGGPIPPVAKCFETISVATVAKSAVEARDHLFLRPHDRIVPNRDRVLAEARKQVVEIASDYTPPEPVEVSLPGPTGRAAIDMAVDGFVKLGRVTEHDEVVAGELAQVLSGGDTDMMDMLSESDLLALERKHFMALIKTPGTLARMEHMLDTGKPLRN